MARQRVFSDNRERDAVAAESQNCPHCGGNGLVGVYHSEYQGNLSGINYRLRRVIDGDGSVCVVREPFIAIAAAHCNCELGRWIRERVEDHLQKRIPRVEDILAGRSKWSLTPPGEEYPGHGPTRESINRQFSRGTT